MSKRANFILLTQEKICQAYTEFQIPKQGVYCCFEEAEIQLTDLLDHLHGLKDENLHFISIVLKIFIPYVIQQTNKQQLVLCITQSKIKLMLEVIWHLERRHLIISHPKAQPAVLGYNTLRATAEPLLIWCYRWLVRQSLHINEICKQLVISYQSMLLSPGYEIHSWLNRE